MALKRQAKLTSKVTASIETSSVKLLFAPDEVTIDPELKQWIVERDLEDIQALEDDIVKDGGIRDAIVVWPTENKLVVVDGYTRHKIAKKHNFKFRITRKEFRDKEEAKIWMVDNQSAQRRNLTPLQTAYYIGWEYDRLKQDKTGNLLRTISPTGQNVHSTQSTDLQIVTKTTEADGQNVHSELTSEFLARRYNLKNEKTVRRYNSIYLGLEWVKKANRTVFKQVFTGEEDVNLGHLEKLGVVKLPHQHIESFSEVLKLINPPEEKKSKKNKHPRVDSKVDSLFKHPTAQAKKETLAELHKLIKAVENLEV
jgi:hypothetical protein